MRTFCGTILAVAVAAFVANAEGISRCGFIRADELGGDCHSPSRRTHDGIPSLAVSDVNGRMWAVWYSSTTGSENSSNYLVLSTSADGGKTWREAVIYDPDGSGPLRAFDSELWIAPDGRMRWTWTEREATVSSLGSPSGDRLMMVELDAEQEPDIAALSAPGNLRQIGRGIMMCKPIVLKDGTWLLPVARWFSAPSACVYASTDGGRTFVERGGVTLPVEWRGYDEHNLVELRDGTLRAYIRVKKGPEGLWESESSDGGFTWSTPHPSVQPHVDSRAFVRRLSSGNLLMVKNGLPGERLRERRNMTAYLSEDDGKTWPFALPLDTGRKGVSYPDGQQLADGRIVVVYDFDRMGSRQILHAVFREEDVKAGFFKMLGSRPRRTIYCGNPAFAASGGGLALNWREGSLVLRDAERNENMFVIPGGRLFLPDFTKGAALAAHEKGVDGTLTLRFSGGDLDNGVVTVSPCMRGFKVNGAFTPKRDVVMNRLDILSAGTTTLFYEINNYRNFHATDRVWTRIVLGDPSFSTDTYSKDWQFAPHPSAMLFTRNDAHFVVGATCAPVGGYGLYAKGGKWKLDGFYLHYGDGEWGWKIKAGETWNAPEFYFAFDRTDDIHESWRSFGADLVKGGYIADPAKRRQIPWHSEHYYCTWGDQTLLSGYIPDADLKKQSLANPSIRGKSWLVLTEKMVMDAAERIRRERLPIRTIIIDGGWMRNTMDFRADPVRFPDFRGMVDRLHSMGFKVMVWWTWSECRDENCEKSIGRHNTMLNGKRNCHGRWMADFSKRSAQDEWLKPTMRRLFSSEPGCYDLDGVKTDYQADKIHFDLPAEDPAWRGEENYFRHIYALFTSEMLKYKSDAQHCGCAGNYFLAEYIDLNRTYDVASDNYLEHENRAKMLAATAPGVLPVYDMHHRGCRTGFADWLDSARRLGVPVHVGNVFEMIDDEFSKPSPMTMNDFDVLRKGLAK